MDPRRSIGPCSRNAEPARFWSDAEHHVLRCGAVFTPEIIDRAAGSYVFAESGRILDFTSGQMSSILGHSHPDVVCTVQQAVARLDHLYSGMLSRPVVELSRKLAGPCPSRCRNSCC